MLLKTSNQKKIFGKVNHLTIKFHGIICEHLPVLQGNEQELGLENIVKT